MHALKYKKLQFFHDISQTNSAVRTETTLIWTLRETGKIGKALNNLTLTHLYS